MTDLFAPDGGWVVRIMDLSGGAQDNITEEIGGFDTLMHANAFARRYVRDSVERIAAVPGASSKEVLEAWFAFGEDAVVIDAEEGGWKSATELGDFVDTTWRADEDRDWRVARSRGATRCWSSTRTTNDPAMRFAPTADRQPCYRQQCARVALANWTCSLGACRRPDGAADRRSGPSPSGAAAHGGPDPCRISALGRHRLGRRRSVNPNGSELYRGHVSSG